MTIYDELKLLYNDVTLRKVQKKVTVKSKTLISIKSRAVHLNEKNHQKDIHGTFLSICKSLLFT